MSKLTAKFAREGLALTCTIMDFTSLEVKGDKKQTFNNVASHLLATAKSIDTALIFESKFPKGVAEIVDGYTSQWEELRCQLVKFAPEQYVEWALLFEVVPAFDEWAEDPAFKDLEIDPPNFDEYEAEQKKKAKAEKKAAKKAASQEESEEDAEDEDEEIEEGVEEEDEDDSEDEEDESEEEEEDGEVEEEGEDDEDLSDDELDQEIEEALDEEFEDETLAEEEEAEEKPAKGGRRRK